jgi:Tetracyclin repressor-like, C-terminal domain
LVLPVPDTGLLRGDLIAFGQLMDRYLKSPLGDTVARTMAAVKDDAALAANRAQVIRIRYGASRQMAERAAERGELRAGISPKMPVELVFAPVYLRKLITRQPVEDKFRQIH